MPGRGLPVWSAQAFAWKPKFTIFRTKKENALAAEGHNRSPPVLRQIGHSVGGLDEFAERRHHRRPLEQFAKEIDLAPQLLMRDGLDKLFRCRSRDAIKFDNLLRRRPRDAQRFTLRGKLRNQSHTLCARGVNASARQEKLSDKCVPQITLQARNATEPWNQAEAQFGKCKTRHFVCHDDVARERQFESAPEADAMNGSDRRERRGIDGVEHGVNPLEKSAHAGNALFSRELRATVVKLAKVGARGKTVLALTVNDARGGFWRQPFDCRNKLFQFREHRQPDFVGRLAIECQFHHAVAPRPAEGFPGERLHALLPAAALLSSASAYIALISAVNRALMASRRNLPITVKSPFSGVRFSVIMVKLRICR